IRWHFLNKERMTVYADLGIGVLFTTDDVPSDGTSFNFTPRAGAGITHRLGDSANRFELGVRWAHISNARTSGDGDNPSRDSIMLYGGVIFPF
ncbi:MAG: acyloxyacyl hydrolase, partial [Phycisphaerales bacterium]